MAIESVFEISAADVLVKVGVFVVVQALVYLILFKSSNVFSSGSKMARSFSFRPARSASIRRFVGALSDFPSAADDLPSPVSKPAELRPLSSPKAD